MSGVDEHSPTLPHDGSSAVGEETPGVPAPGTLIGRFKVIGRLGSGGMGVVLEAHDPELDRRVAIKLLRPELRPGDSGGAHARLRREAQAMAKLAHPNVVAVYEVGKLEQQTFIAMELVEGCTLTSWIRERPEWRRVVVMFVAAGRGLAAAHAAGMVHRDFKPDNVLVGSDGRPRVTDFGLVAGERHRFVAPPDAAVAHSLTIDGSAIGTPAYMSPEHWSGEGVDARSDQFSFCVALWEALWRQGPFPGSDLVELRTAVTDGAIAPPPAEPRVPRRLETMLRRGLSPDPAERWPDLNALLDSLDAVAHPPRRRLPWIAGAVAVAAAAAVVVVVSRGSGGDSPAPSAGTTAEPGMPLVPGSIRRLTFADACEESPAMSPDGATIYYDATVGPDIRLYSVAFSGGEPRELTDTAGWDLAPAPSPDGDRIAFLRKTVDHDMSLFVGRLGDLPGARPIAPGQGTRPFWSPDGRSVWSGELGRLTRYDAATGAVSRTLAVAPDHIALRGAELSDGRVIALLAPIDDAPLADSVVSFRPGATTGDTLYAGSLYETLEVLPGERAVVVAARENNATVALWRVPLGEGVASQLVVGTIPARNSLAISGTHLVWSDCVAHGTIATFGDRGFVDVARNDWRDWGPVGVRGSDEYYFLSDRSGQFMIHRADRTRPGPTTAIPVGERSPDELSISPDGTLLAFADNEHGVFVVAADGSAEPKAIAPDTHEPWPAIDRHNRDVYFVRVEDRKPHVVRTSVTGGAVTRVVEEPSSMPAPSPVEDVLAYVANPTPATMLPMLLDLRTGKRRQVVPDATPEQWDYLRWSPDGERLLLIQLNARIVEVEAATGTVLRELPTGSDELDGVTFVGDEIVVGRTSWSGDLWAAELARQ